MIPIECPKCGKRGNIPPDRLMQRMHCKKCDATFYMDSGGRMMLGEPPREGEKPGKGGKPAKTKAQRREERGEAPDLLGPLGDFLRKVPKPVYALLVVGVVLALAAPRIMGIVKPPPQNLEQRTRAAGEALAKKDISALRQIAVGDTFDSLEDWVNQAHAFAEGTLDPAMITTVDTFNTFAPGKGATTGVTFLIVPDPSKPTELSRSVNIPLLWASDGSNYYLHGKVTLEALQNQVEAKKKLKEPAKNKGA